MAGWWQRMLKAVHPEGIPWPGTAVYNAISGMGIFQEHYRLVAADVGRYCRAGRVLDVGTGPGWLLLAIRKALPSVRIVGLDISEAMVTQAKRNVEKAGCGGHVEVTVGSAAALPFGDEAFDMVVSTGSIHHWKDTNAALDEVHRVLKRGGWALICDLVRNLPGGVARETARKFGKARLALMWVHSFEEPFYSTVEMESLVLRTRFGKGETRFVGALACLVLRKS